MRETTAPSGATGPTPYHRQLLRRRLPVLGAAVAVLAILGPFGTFQDMRFAARLAYWGGLIAVGAVLFDLVIVIAKRRRPANHERTWPSTLAAALVTVSVILTLCVATLEHELRGLTFDTPLAWAELYGYVVVITLLVSALPVWMELRDQGLIEGLIADRPAETPGPSAPTAWPDDGGPVPQMSTAVPAAPFLDRIPAKLGRDLLALEMEDHYVRVHTMAGSDLILMRLRDAVAGLTGVDGLQVHRSYWVATAAVVEVERRPDGKLALRLTNGLRIPVSRSFAGAVRAAGWTERTSA